jgi:hypothetical protein
MHPEFSGDAVTEVQKALKINIVLAKAIVAEAIALHPRARSRSRSGSPPASGSRRKHHSRSPPSSERRWQPYNDKLHGSNTTLESELKRFMESLLVFVYGQSDELGAILREFCIDPGMGDAEFDVLNAKVSERLQRQLAAALMPALPMQMGQALSAKLKPGVYGMVLLRAVCAHHYGPIALKAKLLTAANLCYNEVVPVTQKCDLRERLDAHLRAIQYLIDAGQALGDAMKMVGIHKLISLLHMQAEIDAARNIHERSSLVWESKDLLELIEKRANEWLLLPTSGKQVAAAAGLSTGHVANCHKWMGGDCTKLDCIFKHDPAVKGRSDLIPTCNMIRQKGACDLPACTFNHPKQSAKAARKLAAQLAQQSAMVASSPANTPTVTQTQEVSELKAMIVGLVQQQQLAAWGVHVQPHYVWATPPHGNPQGRLMLLRMPW